MRFLIGAIAALVLAACAASPTSWSEAKQATTIQLLAYQAKPAGAYGTL